MSSNDSFSSEDLPSPRRGILAGIAEGFHILVWFFLDWRYSRNWKTLLGGLPAILVGGTTLVILMVSYQTRRTTWLEVYQRAGASALKQEDYAAADVYFRRMVMLHDLSPETIYRLAQAAVGQGDYDRARSLMRHIAPENAAGYPWAHFWLAQDMLKRGGRLTPEEDRIVEHHLKQSLAGDTQNNEAHALLGQLYWSRGDTKNAIPHLEEAARERPELFAAVAVMYARQKDDRAAQSAAAKARDYLSQKTKTSAEPKVLDYRVQWALTEVLLQNYAEAVRILQAGLTSSDPKRFHDTLVGVYLSWYQAVSENDKDGFARRLELLNLALAHGPNNPQVLAVLADLGTRDSKGADKLPAALEKALAQGTAPAVVHAILGTRALQKGDLEKARVHLELANQCDPRMPLVLNNLAWLLATRAKPDLERALPLAEAAKKLSQEPELSATLGTILLRMGRHRQAVKELETAVGAFPDRASLHEELAACYDKLGDTELAKLHRRLARQATTPTPRPAPPPTP